MTPALLTFVFVFGRIASALSTLPTFSLVGIPKWVTALLALALSALVSTGVPPVDSELGLGQLGLALATEVLAGTLLGLGVAAAFASLGLATELMSGQVGLSFATMFDPMTKAQETVLGTLASLLGGAVFIGLGLHHRCLEILSRSFEVVPPGAASIPSPEVLVAETASCFALGVQLAGPIVAMVWLIHLTTALLARFAPKMNAFFSVGNTLTGSAGIALLLVSLPWLIAIHSGHVARAVDTLATGR